MNLRPTTLHIDLAALTANYRRAEKLANGGPVLAVVKADAYGHGAVPVARTLTAAGASHLGVATVGEGEELRGAGIDAPILLLGGYVAEEVDAIVAARLTPALFCEALIAPLRDAAGRAGITVPVHVKVDTGMGRIGFTPEEAPEVIGRLMAAGPLPVEGVFTHFAEADLQDSPAAKAQLDVFAGVHAALGGTAREIPYWHAANSAALLSGLSAGDGITSLFRPGIMLYGAPPSADFDCGAPLSPVATWTCRIIQIKEVPAGGTISYGRTFTCRRPSRIATLPVGYADGYRRALSNRGEALIRGRRAPVAGRVCMDMVMVDVTDLPEDIAVGEEVVLMGRQGGEEISATELAAHCDTIAYDILCGISERVPRRYLNAPPPG